MGGPRHAFAPSPPLVGDSATVAPALEAELVLHALRLLRNDRDAAGALRELDLYRARFPDGDLAEEVLALSIEAHAALADGAARTLAAEYLRRFPHARFRALAERVQRASSGADDRPFR